MGLALSLFILIPSLSWADSGSNSFALSLKQAEQQALESSQLVKEQESIVDSVLAQQKSISASTLPQLQLEGAYTYLETVPEMQVGNMRSRLGDNENYSLGPVLTYSLWDGGLKKNLQKSLESMALASQARMQSLRRNVLLNVRLAYLRVLVHKEEVNLVEQRLKLAQLQKKDIERKKIEGASSKLELSLSRRESLQLQLELENKTFQLHESIVSLFHLTGHLNSEIPTDEKNISNLDGLDTIESIIPTIEAQVRESPTTRSSEVKSLQLKAQSLLDEAESERSKNRAKIGLRAKTSIDYPNGPIEESFHQNTVGVTLTIPLINWGANTQAFEAKRALARAEEAKANSRMDENLKTWKQLSLETVSLKRRLKISIELVKEAESVTKINRQSYQAGRIKFSDLESAHIRELEVKFEQLRIKSLIFSKLALLANLSEGESEL